MMVLWQRLGFLAIRTSLLCVVLLPAGALACRGRAVVQDHTNGNISQGSYSDASPFCEWLIDGAGGVISLQILDVDVECGLDYVFVHDGDSRSSPLLATVSRSGGGDVIIASSGQMLIYTSNNNNDNKNGFRASFTVFDCPQNCSAHGQCTEGVCRCNSGWNGVGCDVPLCPLNCQKENSQGVCSDEVGQCQCKNGFFGDDCSFSLFEKKATVVDLSTTSAVFAQRSGHAMAYISKSMWIFGGSSSNGVLEDFISYNTTTSKWRVVAKTSTDWPHARHLHTLTVWQNNLYMFGGELSDGRETNELWRYNLKLNRWKLLDSGVTYQPRPVAMHTATVVDNSMFVFGGRTHHRHLTNRMYVCDLDEVKWQKVDIKYKHEAGLLSNLRLAGHTTVFYEDRRLLLVYGGYGMDEWSITSDRLFAFHVDQRFWAMLSAQSSIKPPSFGRAFHTASIIGHHMVVFGGHSLGGRSQGDSCFSHQPKIFDLTCHCWKVLDSGKLGISNKMLQRVSTRYGHGAVSVENDALILSGGFRDIALGDIVAIRLPLSTTEDRINCSEQSKDTCEKHSVCMWCSGDRVSDEPARCMSRSTIPSCFTERDTILEKVCNDTCLVHSSCPDAKNGSLPPCGWCAGLCLSGKALLACVKIDRQKKWCNPSCGSHKVTRLYSNSADPQQPSEVEHGDTPKSDFESHTTRRRFNQVTLLARVTPLDNCSLANRSNETSMVDRVNCLNRTSDIVIGMQNCFGRVEVGLNLQKMDVKLEIPQSQSQSTNREWLLRLPHDEHSSSLVKVVAFRNKDKGDNAEVYIRELHKSGAGITTTSPKPLSSSLEDVSLKSVDKKDVPPIFGASLNFSPFTSGNCSAYTNCSSCLVDINCVWCSHKKLCVSAALATVSAGNCQSKDNLITDYSYCNLCGALKNCKHCTMQSDCGWNESKQQCVRRDLSSNSSHIMLNSSQCSLPCQKRYDCLACMEDVNTQCVWCESTQQCLSQVAVHTVLPFGKCRQLFYSRELCNNCSTRSHCHDCLASPSLGCGWYFNMSDPFFGNCMEGGFSNPFNDTDANNSSVSTMNWSYTQCPDLMECERGHDDCDIHAACINTAQSYICTCLPGFRGNGTSCQRWCTDQCKNGRCSGAPDYKCHCDVGWTGPVCDTDCLCNFHSTCQEGLGLCDHCQDHFTGRQCEACMPGYFMIGEECEACDCGGHGNMSQGLCNNVTGHCYCGTGYEGWRCERCEEGYVRGGNMCYHSCPGRLLISGLESGGVTSHTPLSLSDSTNNHCYVIIVASQYKLASQSTTETLMNAVLPGQAIAVQVDAIGRKCLKDHILLYDGIAYPAVTPVNSTMNQEAKFLASFSSLRAESLSALSLSGIVTLVLPLSTTSNNAINVSFRLVPCEDSSGCSHQPCWLLPSVSSESGDSLSGDSLRCSGSSNSSRLSMPYCHHGCKERASCVPEAGGCICWKNTTGASCAVPSSDSVNWQMLSNSRTYGKANIGSCQPDSHCPMASFPPVYLHTVIALEDSKELLVFGGLDEFSAPTDHLLVIDVNRLQWWRCGTSTTHPSPRFAHSAVSIANATKMLVFGGVLGNGTSSSELWSLDIATYKWTTLKMWSLAYGVAGHTATIVNETLMVVIGGYSSTRGVLVQVNVFDATAGEWLNTPVVRGTTPAVLGHTAVFVQAMQVIFVYGGYGYHPFEDRPSASQVLYQLDLLTWQWSQVQGTDSNSLMVPPPLLFHSAVLDTSGRLMILYGKEYGEFCQRVEGGGVLWLYDTECNVWMKIEEKSGRDQPVFTVPPPRLGHSFVSLGTSRFLSLGGFDNTAKGTMLDLQLPLDWCRLLSQDLCQVVSSCSWCSIDNQEVCVGRDQHVSNCTTNLHNGCALRPSSEQSSCSLCQGRHSQGCDWCIHCMRYTSSCVECTESAQSCVYTDASPQAHLLGESAVDGVARLSGQWTCQNANTSANYSIIDSPLLCPQLCSSYQNCSQCTSSRSPEGGDQFCVWSLQLARCLSPVEKVLRCVGGRCGQLITSAAVCSLDCSQHKLCHRCLLQVGCGWCSATADSNGTCMSGSIEGPTRGVCGGQRDVSILSGNPLLPTISTVISELNVTNGSSSGTAGSFVDFVWSFLSCPYVNECYVGSHSCQANEICTDTGLHYRCDCAPGFSSVSCMNRTCCLPQCTGKCGQGVCVAPNTCKCFFGWTGALCDKKCLCNNQSDCANGTAEGLQTCLACHDNTEGPQCQWCKEGFVDVARPEDFTKCVPCVEYCFGHSSTCALLNRTRGEHSTDKTFLSATNTVCIGCANFSSGRRCNECKPGYFSPPDLRNSAQGIWPCYPCDCNDHGIGPCDLNGTCNCGNKTYSSCSPEQLTCYKHQCDECDQDYSGKPADGRQCYHQMSADAVRVLNIRELRTEAISLLPRYTNVDIRITINVLRGAVDLWLSKDPTSVAIKVEGGIQRVYTVASDNHNMTSGSNLVERCESLDYATYEESFGEPPKIVAVDNDRFSWCGLQGRLVVNIQHTTHKLKTQKFFMIVRGRAVLKPSLGLLEPGDNETVEVLMYFYQDLSEINLFIFFSCFFSGFFLILGFLILLWKVRAIHRARVFRAQTALRRETMAKRPFLKAHVVWKNGDHPDQDVQPGSASIDGKLARQKPPSSASLNSHIPSSSHSSYLAVQPTADDRAAVVTTFIRVPGTTAQGNLMFASTLAQCGPSEHGAGGLKWRGNQMSSMTAQLNKPWHTRRTLRFHAANNAVAADG